MAVVDSSLPNPSLPWHRLLLNAAFRPTLGRYQSIAADHKATLANGLLLQAAGALVYLLLIALLTQGRFFTAQTALFGINTLFALPTAFLSAGLLGLFLSKFADFPSFSRTQFLISASTLSLYFLELFLMQLPFAALRVALFILVTLYCCYLSVLALKAVYQRTWLVTIGLYGLFAIGSLLLTASIYALFVLQFRTTIGL